MGGTVKAAKATFDTPSATNARRSRAKRGTVLSLFRDPFALAAAVILLALVVVAVAAPLVAPHDPTAQHLMDRLMPPAWQKGGSWSHLLGTDALGRDLLSRIIYGSRISLLIGLTVTSIAGIFGTALGMLAGYLGGRFDTLVMRFIDFQAAIPYFLLATTIMAAIGPGAKNLIIVLSLGSWVLFARFSRSTMLSIRSELYVEAAMAQGASAGRIIFRHGLPNLLSPLVTLATLELSRVILSEAGLSYLGLGVQPPTSAWGLMVQEGHDYISIAYWLSTYPGLMVMICALSINIFATWLRRASDPVQRTRM
jgi:peptide/nickel transport system permease protein